MPYRSSRYARNDVIADVGCFGRHGVSLDWQAFTEPLHEREKTISLLWSFELRLGYLDLYFQPC